jgi:hypothetical protein
LRQINSLSAATMTSNKEIEKFFLHHLLRILFVGAIVIIATDYLFQENFMQYDGVVDFILLGAVIVSFIFFRLGYFDMSVLVITSVTLISMLYQSVILPQAATMSFSVILVVGFLFSVLLPANLRNIMHFITLTGMLAVFSWQATHASFYKQPNAGEVITMGFTYIFLYFAISYSSGYLKMKYDAVNREINLKNFELSEKAYEIEAQNEELTQSQQTLNEMNLNLEKIVNERTERIIKYSYNNAHNLRGPVARLLGLIKLSKLEHSPNYLFLFQKIEEQTNEIDLVVKKINNDLESDEKI